MVISRERGKQVAAKQGLGKNFRSPKKNRSSYDKTRRAAWKVSNPGAETQWLLDQMTSLYVKANPTGPESSASRRTTDPSIFSGKDGDRQRSSEVLGDRSEEDWKDAVDDVMVSSQAAKPSFCNTGKRTTPDQGEMNLYANWNSLLQTLVDDMLSYTSAASGLPSGTARSSLQSDCTRSDRKLCAHKTTSILCFYLDRKLKSVT
ncbi:hypothetical protein CVT26_006916 [Gymnopilus dilepis]|uniref:Uncharacterized protein n=1 Tax=Gymnopilus dilepis TaxID=231916 RepID=A0A409W6A0_9AGAR|nr:hypothetical protein CVT26_006916 [Gymnopilus dilepis]